VLGRSFRLFMIAISVAGMVAIEVASPVAAAGPANDHFAKAIAINSLPKTWTVNTAGATRQADEPQPSDCAASKTVWYTYKATTSDRVDIDTTGSNFRTVVAVYTGSTLATLHLVACSSAVHRQAADTLFEAVAGKNYRIQIGGDAGATGTLKVHAQRPSQPANDARANATSIGALPFVGVPQDNRGATFVSEPTPRCGSPKVTVWYVYTAASDAVLLADIRGADFDGFVAVYSGNALHRADCGRSNSVAFRVHQGATYYLQIGGATRADYGHFKLRLHAITPVANDDFANPKPITNLPTSLSPQVLGATVQPNEEAPSCGTATGRSVWYSSTPTKNTTLRVNSDQPIVVAVFTGTQLGQLHEIACGNPVVAHLDKGVHYSIAVASNYGQAQPTKANVTSGNPPANDDVGDAKHVTTLTFSDTVNAAYATVQASDPWSVCAGTVASTVWYKFNPTVAQRVVADTLGSTFDTVIDVFSGTPTHEIRCNDDTKRFAANYTQSSITFDAVPTVTYWVRVGGYGYQGGTVHFHMRSVVPAVNDDFANAEVVSLGYSASVSTTKGTAQAGEDLGSCSSTTTKGASTLWYRFDPDFTGSATFGAGNNFRSVVTVWTGTSLGTLSELSCSERSTQWDVTAGSTYWIQVTGQAGATGRADLSLTSP
jgi:hypothetical protein